MWRAFEQGLLYREQPFVLGIDAKRLDQDLPEGEKVLIQGIIDVFFIENGEIVLLDYKTDVALRRALKAETGSATVIIVAQRISTVLHANQIIVLDEGRIVGKGTHAQLMESCPEYREIARSQLSQKELNLQKEDA